MDRAVAAILDTGDVLVRAVAPEDAGKADIGHVDGRIILVDQLPRPDLRDDAVQARQRVGIGIRPGDIEIAQCIPAGIVQGQARRIAGDFRIDIDAGRRRLGRDGICAHDASRRVLVLRGIRLVGLCVVRRVQGSVRLACLCVTWIVRCRRVLRLGCRGFRLFFLKPCVLRRFLCRRLCLRSGLRSFAVRRIDRLQHALRGRGRVVQGRDRIDRQQRHQQTERQRHR